MALHWNLENIERQDEVCWITSPSDQPMHGVKAGDVVMNPVTNVLIWATISVDLGSITQENVGEFFARLRMTEQQLGPFLIRAEVDGKRPEGVNAFVTIEEVVAHIGLSCNVSNKTRAQWLKRWNGDLDADVRKVEKHLAEVAAA